MLSVYSNRMIAGAALACLFTAAGCRVDTDKNGDSKNVNISTPFGGLHVRTNNAAELENIGLAAYPGATPVAKHKDQDSADVDMSFGSFQLRVKAATYHTDDPMDKVEAFYRNDLKRFGDVIACRGNQTVGEPSRTMAGLTCESTNHEHISVNDSDTHHEFHLKAGSPHHQHIVGLQPDNGGTKFALVALDLPAGSNND